MVPGTWHSVNTHSLSLLDMYELSSTPRALQIVTPPSSLFPERKNALLTVDVGGLHMALGCTIDLWKIGIVYLA